MSPGWELTLYFDFTVVNSTCDSVNLTILKMELRNLCQKDNNLMKNRRKPSVVNWFTYTIVYNTPTFVSKIIRSRPPREYLNRNYFVYQQLIGNIRLAVRLVPCVILRYYIVFSFLRQMFVTKPLKHFLLVTIFTKSRLVKGTIKSICGA